MPYPAHYGPLATDTSVGFNWGRGNLETARTTRAAPSASDLHGPPSLIHLTTLRSVSSGAPLASCTSYVFSSACPYHAWLVAADAASAVAGVAL